MDAESKYWFPAKTFGWGWGPPSTWQGWVVIIAYLALLSLGFLFASPEKNPAYFITYVTMLSVVLIFVMWKKGEPPSWRWGK